MTHKQRATIERLHEVFEPDYEAGLLRWKITQGEAKVGDIAGSLDKTTEYLRVAVDGKRYMCHIIIWAMANGRWPDKQIGHVSKIRTDNSLANLREGARAQHKQNSKLYKNNQFGLKGVSRHKKGCRADICVNGKNVFLGLFEDPLEAHEAYCDAARENFGQFARAS